MGHNLAFLIWAHVPECTLTLNDLTERVYMDTLVRPTHNEFNHALAQPSRQVYKQVPPLPNPP